MADEADPVAVILWHFLDNEEIAYMLEPDVPLHVQVAYIDGITHHLGPRPLIDMLRSSPAFVRWISRNYVHFSKFDPPKPETEEQKWVRSYQYASGYQYASQAEGTYCGLTKPHQPHTYWHSAGWGKAKERYKCPGVIHPKP